MPMTQTLAADGSPPATLAQSTSNPRNAVRYEVWILLSGLLALTFKLAIAWNTLGTNDVISFYRFGESLETHGLEWTYTNSISFNHPPLTAYFLQAIYRISHQPFFQDNGIIFPFLLRLPAILADFISLLVLLRLTADFPKLRLPTWALFLFALSPTYVMVSGFHGSTDPLMIMFLLLAVYSCSHGNPLLCGLFFSLSCQVKIIPLLLFPIFLFYWMHRRLWLRFLVPFATVTFVLWREPLLNFPAIFIKNVLSYGSFWGLWGITYFLRLTGWSQFGRVSYYHLTAAQTAVGLLLKLLIIACVIIIAWRRRALSATALLSSLAYAWIVFFVFSPGVCAQYMVWLMPYVLILSPALYGYLELTSSLFLFFFYNTIADAFPWYVAISRSRSNLDWTPWSIWPWAVLIAGLIIFWKTARRRDPSLRLFGLDTLPLRP
jgi:uncharacterized membrane protein